MRAVLLLLFVAGCQPVTRPTPSALADDAWERRRLAIRLIVNTDRGEVQLLREKLGATTDRAVMRAEVNNYLERVQRLDLSSCPNTFAGNYRGYLLAWQLFAKALDENEEMAEPTALIDRRWNDVVEVARRFRAVE
jgi:hypothetical protein